MLCYLMPRGLVPDTCTQRPLCVISRWRLKESGTWQRKEFENFAEIDKIKFENFVFFFLKNFEERKLITFFAQENSKLWKSLLCTFVCTKLRVCAFAIFNTKIFM